MHRLELIEVVVVAPRHSLAAHNELREERDVEADKHQSARRSGPDCSLYMRPVILGHQ